MQHNYWIYLFIMFAVTYLVRRFQEEDHQSFCTVVSDLYSICGACSDDFPGCVFCSGLYSGSGSRCSGRCDCGTCGRQFVYRCHFCQRSGLCPFAYYLDHIQKQLNFILFCKIQLFFL